MARKIKASSKADLGNGVVIHLGDCLAVLPTLPADSIDAIVTDPPYGLEFMDASWDKLGAGIETANEGTDKSHPFRDGSRRSRFGASIATMQAWHQQWACGALRVLKPGGYMLSFGGCRTYHRLACAVEDAGFQVRDCIINMGEVPALAWCFGSGFPKGKGCLKPSYEPILCAQKVLSHVDEVRTIAVETTCLLEALLWLSAPACFAKICSRRASTEQDSVRWIATTLSVAMSLERSEVMGMFSSQEEGLTYLSIASSWNNILGVVLARGSTFTTGIMTRLITGLRTLNSWILATIPESIIEAVFHHGGLWFNARGAKKDSSGGSHGWMITQRPTVPEDAWKRTIKMIPSTLARIAVDTILPLRAIIESSVLRLVPIPSTLKSAMPQSNGHASNAGAVLKLSEVAGPFIAGGSAWHLPIALDPILLCRKPGKKVLPLGIDECRVGTNAGWSYPNGRGGKGCFDQAGLPQNLDMPMKATAGRWPANVVHDGSEEVLEAFAAFGERNAHDRPRNEIGTRPGGFVNTGSSSGNGKPAGRIVGDSGTAARFFYCAKANRPDRWAYCRDCAAAFPSGAKPDHLHGHYRSDGSEDWGHVTSHPTVKPIALMEWLVKLVCPVGGTVLDPFLGSGSTGIACLRGNRKFVGMEREPSYFEIAKGRLASQGGKVQDGTFPFRGLPLFDKKIG